MKDLKERYVALQKNYKLPSFEELNNEFELLSLPALEEIPKPLSFIRRRINDRIAWACNLIQIIIQPNPGSFITMYESGLFDKIEKNKMSQLLKELMILERESLCIDVDGTEEQDAQYILTITKVWPQHKKELRKIGETLKQGWREERKAVQSSYLG